MVSLNQFKYLVIQGFAPHDITAAMDMATAKGSAMIGNFLIRFNRDGEMIVLDCSVNEIYPGDYPSHIHFEKEIGYTVPINGSYHSGYLLRAKYRDAAAVFERCMKESPTGEVLCECFAADYKRRAAKVEKCGYKIKMSNYEFCRQDLDICYFVFTA